MNKTEIISLLDRLGVVAYGIESEGDAYRVFVTVPEDVRDFIVGEFQGYTEAFFEYSTELVVYK